MKNGSSHVIHAEVRSNASTAKEQSIAALQDARADDGWLGDIVEDARR